MMLADTATPTFRALAAERLRSEPPGWLEVPSNPRGDHTLDPEPVLPFVAGGPPRAAAVLVPVVLHEDEPAILFTERSTGLREHSGQIAFPGGKMETNDPSPLVTALREAQEEIGLDPGAVTPIGYLDAYLSTTNYLILPVVGLVRPPLALALNPARWRAPSRCRCAFSWTPSITSCIPRSGRAGNGATTRCPTASATSGASRRASCAISTNVSTDKRRLLLRAPLRASEGNADERLHG
jgi:8-oxo-dGTP pyrophosphatase MutT (NUDIX family)